MTWSEIGNLSIAEKPNDEVAIDFVGPFQNASKGKKYLLVSVDHSSGWPETLFLPNPTTDKVLEFLEEYIAQNSIPTMIRTDPGTAFKSGKFEEFCGEY